MTPDQKLDAILEAVNELKTRSAVQEAYQKQQRKELDALNFQTDRLEAERNKAVGIAWLGGALLSALISWLIKNF